MTTARKPIRRGVVKVLTLPHNWLRVFRSEELLVLAKVEGNSGIREWCGQKNAEDSVAQHGTRCK
jgi:hypothetical protein